MKQQFDLPDNMDAMVVLGVLSSQFDFNLPDKPPVDYRHDSSLGIEPAIRQVLVVKGRYLLPQVASVYSNDSDVLLRQNDLSKAQALQPDSVKAQIYLSDLYESDETEFHDGDLAPFKARGDIVIKKFEGAFEDSLSHLDAEDFAYRLVLNGSTIFSRVAGDKTEAVADWNARNSDDGAFRLSSAQEDDDPMVIVTEDKFYQGGKITVAKSALAGARLLLQRTYFDRQNENRVYLSGFRFVLPRNKPQVDSYHYCGKGRDEKAYWCRASHEMVMDTVEIFPDQGFVNVVWRCDWFDQSVGLEQYRALRVKYAANHLQEVA